MKIVVIGAGHGGLQAARTLAKGGMSVDVYERDSYDELCYDWRDDIETEIFDELSIPLPEGEYRRGDCTSLVAPYSKKPLKVPVPEEKLGWSIERRALAQTLAKCAEAEGAAIHYSTPVSSLIIKAGKVCGITVGDKEIIADLVIDSSGALSPFRAALPKAYNIQAMPGKEETFRTYRVFMTSAPGVPKPEQHPKKVYLKHLGEMGISWCMYEPSGEVNILVGRTGELSQKTLDNALAELKRDNRIIGDKIVRGDEICTIPIRYPLSRMVGDGYAAVGDAAFMTIPMIGSGMANSIRAGQMLADNILQYKKADVRTLWKYQVRYFRQIGAEHVGVDMIKRMLLSTDAQDIRFLFDNGVIDEKDMDSISSGEAVVMSPKQILVKVIRGRKKLGVLLKLKSAIGKGEKAQAFAKTIPAEFDEQAVSEWQRKLDAFFA